MEYVEEAKVDEVIGALGKDGNSATKEAVRADGIFHVWMFDKSDIGDVRVQLPGQLVEEKLPWLNEGQGRVVDQYPLWKEWLTRSHPDAKADRALHETLVGVLRAGKTFTDDPILFGNNRQVRDGKHRILAAHEYATGAPAFRLKVYWNQGAPETL